MEHSELLYAHHRIRCLNPENVCLNISVDPPPSQMKHILHTRILLSIEPLLVLDNKKQTIESIYVYEVCSILLQSGCALFVTKSVCTITNLVYVYKTVLTYKKRCFLVESIYVYEVCSILLQSGCALFVTKSVCTITNLVYVYKTVLTYKKLCFLVELYVPLKWRP